MRTTPIVIAATVVALLVPSGLAVATGHVDTVVSFDPAAGEFPEGIAVDKTGDVYVSLLPRDEIRRIAPDGTQATHAFLPPGATPAGLAVAANQTVYVAAGAVDFTTFDSDPAIRGVYRIDRHGAVERLAGTENMIFPNDVALDKRGNVYATDTREGAVWRIPPGGTAEPWLDDPLLDGTGALGFGIPIGANGIAFRHGELVVTNPDRGMLVTVPVQADGSAGTPSVLAASPDLLSADGIAFDVHGDVYVGVGFHNTVVRVTPDGSLETIATGADGLNQPSTVAFGAGRRDNQDLLVANFSIFVPAPTPGVLRVRIGTPGQPVP